MGSKYVLDLGRDNSIVAERVEMDGELMTKLSMHFDSSGHTFGWQILNDKQLDELVGNLVYMSIFRNGAV